MVKRLLSVLLLLAAVPFLNAENIISIDMELYNTVMRTRETVGRLPGYYTDPIYSTTYVPPNPGIGGDKYWAFGIIGSAALSFKSTGNRNVKAELALDFALPDFSGTPVISLKKAYVKAKFPIFRLTVGKTRLGWGDGFVFNSGDVIFGSISPYVNLIGSEVRTETSWITSFNFPIGRFSFIEAMVKLPELEMNETSVPVGMGHIQDLGFGGRLYTKLAGIKVETGYYFDGKNIDYFDLNHTPSNILDDISIAAFHRPYLSLQGNFGPDFYLNSSVAIPGNGGNNLEAIVKDTFNISFGLFHVQEVGYDDSISFRLESVILPFLNWRESDGVAGSYAMLIYPEIAYAIGQNISISLRSIVSPIDLSAQFTAGFSWNVFEGFNLLTYATINAGDGNDTFSWDKSTWVAGTDIIDGISVMAGIKYIY